MNVAMNKKGYKSFDEVMKKGFVALDAIEFESLADTTDALILDTRSADVFAKGFIPSSVNIGIKGDFAPWVGALIGDVEQNILLVCEDGMEEESITRLARVGFDNVLGYLKGGVKTWIDANKEIDTVNRITAKQFEAEFKPKESVVFDIRKESEYTAEHIDEAYNKPLSFINEWINNIDTDQHFYIHCQGGYRSMIGASILQARGIRNFSEVEGGFKEIANTSIPKTDFVCQSKMMSV
jgi:rhodanese-related sulfurtransferase